METRRPFDLARAFAVTAAIATAFLAAPAWSYTIYLKDGSRLVATTKYEVRGERAIIKLDSGTETMLPLAEIDVPRTERANTSDLGTAMVIEGGETKELTDAAPPPKKATLQDLIQSRERKAEAAPATATPTAPAQAKRRRTDPPATERADVVGRSPLRNVALAEAIRTFLFSRGITSVEVLQGSSSIRPLLVFPAGTEGQVFKAITASSMALLDVRGKRPGELESFEVVLNSPDGGGAGRFSIGQGEAQELVSGQIELPAFYVKYVQF